MRLGLWSIRDGQPVRVAGHDAFLEVDLEDWVHADPSLVLEGLTWIGRQVVLPDRSRIDLLGLTREGQWVVAELKQGPVDVGTIAQALHYAMLVGSMATVDLLARLGDLDEEARLLAESTDAETRSVMILVVGTQRGAYLEDGVHFLGNHGLDVPVRAVTFTPFKLASGEVVLARAVEEHDDVDQPRRQYSVEAVLDLAESLGVRVELQHFVDAGRAASLHVKPWPRSITIQSPAHSSKTLVYARPESGRIYTEYSPENFEEAFGATEPDLRVALGENHQTLQPHDVPAYTLRLRDHLLHLQAPRD